MPWAESPSAIAFTSSVCRLQSCAIWSNDRDVFSTSHTAVAFGIKGAVAISEIPSALRPPGGRSHSSTMTGRLAEYRGAVRPAQPLGPQPLGMAVCPFSGFWCLYSRGKFQFCGRDKDTHGYR